MAVTTYKILNVNILPSLAQEIKMFPDAQAHSLPLNRYNKEPQGSEVFNRVGHHILKSLSAPYGKCMLCWESSYAGTYHTDRIMSLVQT